MTYITDLVVKNKYSRPAIKLLGVRGIVLHYTANPSATALNHANFFDGADGGNYRYAGAHLFVDKKESRLIVPLNEVAYHANESACRIPKLKATASYYKGGDANLTTIGIEMCIEKDGSLHPDTYNRTVKLVASLLKQFKLTVDDVYRHYDITGKNCPAFWVSNPAGFTKFKADVKKAMSPSKTSSQTSKNASNSSSKGKLGRVTILAEKLNVRASDSFSARIVKVVSKGSTYNVYAESNGMYKVGADQWISANGKYVKFVPTKTHTVVKGDSLWAIAKKYKTTVEELKKLNGLKTDLLQVGQILRVK